MPKIIYKSADGTDHVRDVEEGMSLMRAALESDVPGIQAECGGAAACATCQVMLDSAWVDRVPPAADLELSMLDEEDEAIHLRLSCQITATAELDGLIVHIPSKQR
jgi:2Fe-2S ferredoxin